LSLTFLIFDGSYRSEIAKTITKLVFCSQFWPLYSTSIFHPRALIWFYLQLPVSWKGYISIQANKPYRKSNWLVRSLQSAIPAVYVTDRYSPQEIHTGLFDEDKYHLENGPLGKKCHDLFSLAQDNSFKKTALV